MIDDCRLEIDDAQRFHPATNAHYQYPAPNPDKPEKCLKLMFVFYSMLDVRCSMLDVHLFPPLAFRAL